MKRTYSPRIQVNGSAVDLIPAGTLCGGDEIPAGTFHGGDEIPAGTFHGGDEIPAGLGDAQRHPTDPVACKVRVGDTLLDGAFRATVLTADSADAFNDIDHPGRVAPRPVAQVFSKGTTSLPPHSQMVMDVPQ